MARQRHWSFCRTVPFHVTMWIGAAVPAWRRRNSLPRIAAPDDFRAIIVNAHFTSPRLLGAPLMLGVIGGTAEVDILPFPTASPMTISGADHFVDMGS